MNHEVTLLKTGMTEKEIANLTRMCYGKFNKKTTPEQDQKTLKNLIKKDHLTPFEMSSMTFKIKCPIYVQRQIMRHRTGSYLEKSLRYTKGEPEFEAGGYAGCGEDFEKIVKAIYKDRLKEEKPEDARKVLPLSTLTEFIFHMDLRNLMHFFTLRLDSHAQKETRQIAKEMFVMFSLLFPTVAKAYYEKEVGKIGKAFKDKELGEIWPVAEESSGDSTSEIDSGDPDPDRSELSDDSLVSEETSDEERKVRQATTMGDNGSGISYTEKYEFVILGY